jgi:hypothetical protein
MRASLVLLGRREVLRWAAAGSAFLVTGARADALPPMEVFRDPDCGCCHKWVEHLVANGFAVTVNNAPRMRKIKMQFGVPPELAACHTGEIGGYVIEGHVPAVAIKRLLAEKPKARGLAVPGMPVGSPGMEGGTPEIYEVILFGSGDPRRFGRFREDKPV